MTKEYDGYYYQVAKVIRIAVRGSLCRLKNMKQAYQWASNERKRTGKPVNGIVISPAGN